MKKPTQKQAIFWQLFKNKRGDNEYIPVHCYMGEIYIDPLDTWAFVSYEVSARFSEINSENPSLLDWTTITGKSGARYRGYRIREGATREDIKDPKLLEIYDRIFNYGLERSN